MNEVDENSRYGKYSKWARQMLREERRRIRNKAKEDEYNQARRLHIKEELLEDIRIEVTSRRIQIDASSATVPALSRKKSAKKKPSRNTRMNEKKIRNKYGIDIPNTVADARRLDKISGTNYWMKAIDKELTELQELNVFKFHEPNK